MHKNRLIALTSLLAVLAAPAAFAKARFGFVVDGAMAKQTITASGGGVSASVSSDNGMGFGGGLMMHAGLGSADLKISAIYQLRKTKFGATTQTFPAISVPVTVGFAVARTVDIDLGGYYAMGMGNITDSASGGSTDYAAAGFSKSDFGLRGGLSFGLGPSALLGAYYQMGLKDNLATPVTGGSVKWSEMGVTLAMLFGGGH